MATVCPGGAPRGCRVVFFFGGGGLLVSSAVSYVHRGLLLRLLRYHERKDGLIEKREQRKEM